MTAFSIAKKDVVTASAFLPRSADEKVSHNLNGQKLGRKGRVTRERILAVTVELLNETADAQISVSAVARRAALGMTSLYNYFSDLTELLLAVFDPVMHEAGEEDGYFRLLTDYWPDDRLDECCREFIESYYAFWVKHSRILHLRNNMADQYDERMMVARVRSAQPTITFLRKQLALDGQPASQFAQYMASVLMTSIERVVTVSTDTVTPAIMEREFGPRHMSVIGPLTRMFILTVRDCRQGGGQG